MENIKKHKITVEDYEGNITTIFMNWDSDVWDWVDVFRKILLWLNFYPQTVEEALGTGTKE